MPADHVLRIDSARADDLDRLHPWLDGVLKDLPGAMHHAIRVALEEVVMNVAMHGFASGDIIVRSPEAAVFIVEDQGGAFDPSVAPAPPRPAEPGGMGLVLLHHYCSDIAYERIGDRNRLILRWVHG
jgi:anti-sigma regulatory factor (Ser/Thr protein kinase)